MTHRSDAEASIVAAGGRRHPTPTARTAAPSTRLVVGRLAAAGISSGGFLFGVASLASGRLEGTLATDSSGSLKPAAPAAITKTIFVDQYGNLIPDPALVPLATAPAATVPAAEIPPAPPASDVAIDPAAATAIDSAMMPAPAIVPPPVVPAPDPVAPPPVPQPSPKSVDVAAPVAPVEDVAPEPEAVAPVPAPVVEEPVVEQPPVVEQAPPVEQPAPVEPPAVEQPVDENPPAPACEGSMSC